jgi:hypothetical protein
MIAGQNRRSRGRGPLPHRFRTRYLSTPRETTPAVDDGHVLQCDGHNKPRSRHAARRSSQEMLVKMVTGAGIEPAARALKVRCSTTELPGRSRSRAFRLLRTAHCTIVNGTETSVVSHVIVMVPPGAVALLTMANVSCSTGVGTVRFVIATLPRSADGL